MRGILFIYFLMSPKSKQHTEVQDARRVAFIQYESKSLEQKWRGIPRKQRSANYFVSFRKDTFDSGDVPRRCIRAKAVTLSISLKEPVFRTGLSLCAE